MGWFTEMYVTEESCERSSSCEAGIDACSALMNDRSSLIVPPCARTLARCSAPGLVVNCTITSVAALSLRPCNGAAILGTCAKPDVAATISAKPKKNRFTEKPPAESTALLVMQERDQSASIASD